MTAPQQQTQSLLDLEQPHHDDRRASGPVSFPDDGSLQGRLERRSTERRRHERRGAPDPSAGADLGARELCHDLRQPLASVFVLTHMLEKEMGLTAAGRQRLGLLQAELGRLASMLTSRLEAVDHVLVDVPAVVRAVCDAPVDRTAVPVELLLDRTPLVLGDPVQLSRLVGNLVANARGAAGPGGRVRVQVDGGEGTARICVEDSGGAVGAATTPGFGLGLMIVDSVVKRHGGGSTCSASDLGGLRIVVTLPAGLPSQHVGGSR